MLKKILVIILVSLLLGVTGCSTDKEPVQPPEQPLVIGLLPDVESIPLVIAEKNGFFEQAGVQVKLEHFKSAKDRDSALQSGNLDGVISDIVAVAFANDGGIPLKIAAKTDGNILLLAGKDSNVLSIADLKGKEIGLSNNTVMEYSFDQMLLHHQIDPGEAHKVAIPQLPTRLEMLQAGKLPAAILPEPLASLGEQSGALILCDTNELGEKAGVIAFTAQSLENNQAAIRSVFQAYNQAVTYLQEENPATYIDFLIETQGFPANVKDILQLPNYHTAQLPAESTVQNVLTWMQDKGLLQNQYTFSDLTVSGVLPD